VAANPATDSAAGWAAWTPAERESFFAAIARHRLTAWRVTFASRVINLAVALIVAVLMSPLFYGALALLLDLLNLALPAPNLVPGIGHALDKVINAPGKMSVAEWVQFGVLAALPGLVWIALVLNAMRRVLGLYMAFDSGELSARAPDPTLLAEQRFGNVVAEMAIAANLPQPRVFVAHSPVVDAVAFGMDEQHSTIVISQGLLALLNRAQMEGVAANLIASIANGDMQIGVRAALSLSLFALITRLGTLVTQRHARRNLTQIVVATLLPTRARARKLVMALASPFDDDADEKPAADRSHDDNTPGGRESGAAASPSATAALGVTASLGATANTHAAANPGAAADPRAAAAPSVIADARAALVARWEKIRPFLWLPLAGPLVMTGFLGAIFNLFVLGPLLSLAWRQRKYMADATAVRLTRDPDTLAGALQQLTAAQGPPLAPWAAHMSVADHRGQKTGVFGSNAVPMFPSIDRRLRALASMGAHITRAAARPQIPLRTWLIIAPLLAVLAVLVAILFPLMIWVSLALTMLFSGLPFAIVHVLLRWLGHH
jgi:Zn-dependent protease with chaperone function